MAPVYITQAQVRRLPFWVLVALVSVYACAGLIGRDPWKTDDAATFGAMWTLANGGWLDWLQPNVAGAPFTSEGPAFIWLGAICVKALAWLTGAAHAARLATVLAIVLGITWVWRATFALARRPEAQPNNPLGTAPDPQGYGRMVADAAVLLLMATLGMVVRLHENTSEVGQWALCCLALYGMASTLHRPIKGGLLFGLALAGSLLGQGFLPALMLLTAGTLTLMFTPRFRFAALRFVGLSLLIPSLFLSIWYLTVSASNHGGEYLARWLSANTQQLQWALHSVTQWKFLGTNALLFAWPLWPIALQALKAWRKRWQEVPIALPLAFAVSALLAQAFGSGPNDVQLMMLYPPLAILAAFGIPALRRSLVNFIDWLAAMSFTLAGVVIWIGWLAVIFGIPTKLARSAARLAPDYQGSFVWAELIIAILVSALWLWIILWRTQRRPQALWRAVALSMAGLLLVWTLATTLWMPWVNSTKTYRVVAEALAKQIPRHLVESEACINTVGLGLAQRASFAYFVNLNFAPIDYLGEQPSCRWVLLQDNPQDGGDDTLPDVRNGTWKKVWEGRRASDRNERFRLYEAIATEKRKPKFRRR